MKKVLIKDKVNFKIEPNVSCIGYFDGVHIGHQKLIKETLSKANKYKVKSSIICFNPDPIEVISGNKNHHLTSYTQRLRIFEDYGFDYVIVIRFDNKFMKVTADKFISNYLNKLNIKELICGYDFTFGHKATGNYKLLKQLGNFELSIIEKVSFEGEKVSSTRIKQNLFKGNFKAVLKMLNYNYYIEVKVLNSCKINDYWLIKTKLKDKYAIMPIDGKYDEDIEIKNGYLYLKSINKIAKNKVILLNI